MNRLIRKLIFEFGFPFALLAAPFLLPVYHFTFDIPTLLTVVSLVFAILIGFFIATSTTNYLRLQSLIANEDSALISIFNLSKMIQPSAVSKIKDTIDQYATSALDFELTEYVEKTQKEFSVLLAVIDELMPIDARGLSLIQCLHEKRDDLVRTRQEATLVARRIVTFLHWTVLVLLAVLLVVLLLSLRNGHWLSSSITGVLSLATYLVLLILYEVDGNIFLEEQLTYQNTQQVFKAIGTMKYIPEHALKNKRVTIPDEDYRIGTFNEKFEKEITVVRRG